MSKRNKPTSSNDGKKRAKQLNPEKKQRKDDQLSKRQIVFDIDSDDDKPLTSTTVKEIREKLSVKNEDMGRNLSVITIISYHTR